ncbi:hypothetical protein EI94DRAFT_588450 [Lactarius quietus]|nr:hypothetical protein EI94DRAFT_588450 [Lactarius quietus]
MEPVKAAPASIALTHESIHRSQHYTKGSTQGNGSVVLPRQYLHRMEVRWLPLVDLRNRAI